MVAGSNNPNRGKFISVLGGQAKGEGFALLLPQIPPAPQTIGGCTFLPV